MGDTRILIVVNDEEAGNAYSQALSHASVAHDVARSFKEMAAMATETAYNGLVIDVLTLVRCSKEEKLIAYDCINLFPVLRVKWESRDKKINLSLVEQHSAHDVESALRLFIGSRCSSFPARTLRKHKRKHINLNVLLSLDDTFAEEKTEKTFTVTVSAGGAFLYTMQNLETGVTVWVRLVDFPDHPPIPATVRWSLPWGTSRSIPGVGVSFETLTKEQEQELAALLK